MRRPRYIDFTCPACGTEEERFSETDDDGAPLAPEHCTMVIVATCGVTMVPRELATPLIQTINKHNSDYGEREKARLTARSNAHWKREGRDVAIDRERKQNRGS